MTVNPARFALMSLLPCALLLAGPANPAQAQPVGSVGSVGSVVPAPADRPLETPPSDYVQLVDLSLIAPVIVRATITRTRRISGRAAPGLIEGQSRLLIEAEVEAALIAPGRVPQELSWLQDVPDTERDAVRDRLADQRVIAWLRAPSAKGQTALVAGNAARPWSAALEAQVRAIATEIQTKDIPVVTGVSNGFRVAGTIAGEAESQFFLKTTDNRPLTMVVLDRPGQARSVSIASSDIIDESATSVKPNTLLWYRLACTLPTGLPASAGGQDRALANVWSSAVASLGACNRP